MRRKAVGMDFRWSQYFINQNSQVSVIKSLPKTEECHVMMMSLINEAKI